MWKMTPETINRPTRMSRRRFVAGAAGVGTAVAAAACAPADAFRSRASLLPKKQVTLRLGERAGTEEQALDTRLPYFQEQFPHLTVEREVIAGNMIEVLRAMSASGTLPDNVHAYAGDQSYHTFASRGALLNIGNRLRRDKVALTQWFPELIDIMHVDGQLYGLPFKGQVLGAGLFYNVSLFKQRGVSLPNSQWTLDDLVDAAQRLTIRQGSDTVQWGYAVGTWEGASFNAHLRQWGGDTFARGGQRATFDSRPVVDALQWYERLFNRERVIHPLNDAATAFVDGKVAMIGRAFMNFKTMLLPDAGERFAWDGMLMPPHPVTRKRGGMFSGDTHSIGRDCKHQDEAFELLKFMTDKEFGVTLGLQTSGSTTLGGRPDVYADQRIVNHPQLTKQMQLAQLNSVREMREPHSVPWNFRASEVYAVRDGATARIARGEASADPAYLREVNREIQNILNLPRP